MQLLRQTTNRRQKSSRSAQSAAELLDVMPPVMWFIRHHMRRHRSANLQVPHFRTLALLDRFPTASLSLVAEHLGSSLPTASRMVSCLVSRKLIRRDESSSDRRQVSLRLTREGQTILEGCRRMTRAALAEQLADFSDEEHEALDTVVRALKRVFVSEPEAN